MGVPRALEVDVAYELGRLPFVVGVFALEPELHPDRRDHPDALLFAVTMRPYSVEGVVEAHYLLLTVVDHVVSGKVLYVDATVGIPLPVRRARPVTLDSAERVEAAERATARTVRVELARRGHRDEELRAAAALRRMLGESAGSVTAGLGGGVFEIVRDPFPSLLRQPARLLVLDEDPRTEGALRALGGEVVVERPEPTDWGAIERSLRGRYDLILCALRFGSWTGSQLHRLMSRDNPEMARRLVFLSDVAPTEARESARGRVLTKPIDLEELRRMLYARRLEA